MGGPGKRRRDACSFSSLCQDQRDPTYLVWASSSADLLVTVSGRSTPTRRDGAKRWRCTPMVVVCECRPTRPAPPSSSGEKGGSLSSWPSRIRPEEQKNAQSFAQRSPKCKNHATQPS